MCLNACLNLPQLMLMLPPLDRRAGFSGFYWLFGFSGLLGFTGYLDFICFLDFNGFLGFTGFVGIGLITFPGSLATN